MSSEKAGSGLPSGLALAGLVALGAVVWAPGVAGGSIINGDDALYAIALRQLGEGAPVAQTLGWRPPLFYLIGWASTAVLGLTELGLRLPSLLCGLAALSATYFAARQLFRERPSVAFWACMLLVASSQWFQFARRVRGLDLLLVAVLTAAVGLGASRLSSRTKWAAVGAALAAGVLTKSVVVVTVGPALLLCWLSAESGAAARAKSALWVAVPVLLATGGWWLWMTASSAGAQAADHVENHIVRRATDAAMVAADRTPVTFYVEALVSLEGLLAALFFVGVGYVAWCARRERSSRVVLAWTLGALVPFSLVATKLPHYALPAYPALAIGTALVFDALARRVRPALAWGAAGVLWACAMVVNPLGPVANWGMNDFSPHLKAASDAAGALGEEGAVPRLTIWNEYHVAAAFYHRGHALLWTDNDGFWSAYENTHGFVSGYHFERVEGQAFADALREDAPACVFVPTSRASAAAQAGLAAVDAAGGTVRPVEGGTLGCVLNERD